MSHLPSPPTASPAPTVREVGGAARLLEVGARRYRVMPLDGAERGGALLCEALPGTPLPEYAVRRQLRAVLAPGPARVPVVFTDAARSMVVWSWTDRAPGEPLAYHESIAAGGSRPRECGAVEHCAVAAGTAAEAGRRAGIALVARLRPVAGATPREVQCAVEETDDPDWLRALWRALQGVRVLDPRCGDGSWLLGVQAVLEPVHLACLERMRSWLADLARARAGGSPARLADFRRTIGRADDASRYAGARHYVRHRLALHTLFGADPDPGAVAATRRRLEARLRAGDGGAAHRAPYPELEHAVRCGDAWRGCWAPAELQHGPGRPGGAGSGIARLVEEVEAVRRAEALLRTMRLQGRAEGEEGVAGWNDLRRRKDRLAAELDRVVGVERAVHPWLEFAPPGAAPGFTLVREVER